VIVACIALIAVYHFVDGLESRYGAYKPVVILESAALVAFGISWLVKGEAVLKD